MDHLGLMLQLFQENHLGSNPNSSHEAQPSQSCYLQANRQMRQVDVNVHLVISLRKGGPEYIHPNTAVLMIESPKNGTPDIVGVPFPSSIPTMCRTRSAFNPSDSSHFCASLSFPSLCTLKGSVWGYTIGFRDTVQCVY